MKKEYKKPLLAHIELEEFSPICASVTTGDTPDGGNPAFAV